MNILAYRAETITPKTISLMCSDGEFLTTSDWSDAISFLLKPCDMAVVWNIDVFTDIITTLFPKVFSEALKEGGRVFAEDKTKFYYQPGRMLGITYGWQEVNFYGLHRYQDDEIKDPKELAVFGQKVLDAYKSLGIIATKLTSPVACFDMSKIPFPRACDLPDTALPLLNACVNVQSREWRDVYKLGHWNSSEVSDFDLHAAYPSIMAGLPDISHATYFEATELPTDLDLGKTWGEMTGRLKIVKPVSPFYHEDTESYPVGEWVDSITTDQLWLLKRWGIGEFQMEKGYFFTLPKNYALPFCSTMQNLYRARDTVNPIAANIAKAISVGIGGKLAQRYEEGELGADFNSIYARMVTSRCEVKVCDFIYRNHLEDKAISVQVDGVLTEGKIPDLVNVKKMGTWRKNPDSSFLVASLLFQWGLDKHPNGEYYSGMMELINEKPRHSVYADVDLNLLERSRVFKKIPHTGKELIESKFESEPMTV